MSTRVKKKTTPSDLFTEADVFVLHVAGDPDTVVYSDVLAACDAQRDYDPKMTWIVRQSDGAILKIRNRSTNDLKKLVQRQGDNQ